MRQLVSRTSGWPWRWLQVGPETINSEPSERNPRRGSGQRTSAAHLSIRRLQAINAEQGKATFRRATSSRSKRSRVTSQRSCRPCTAYKRRELVTSKDRAGTPRRVPRARRPGSRRGRLEDSQTERGHLDPVIEGHGLHGSPLGCRGAEDQLPALGPAAYSSSVAWRPQVTGLPDASFCCMAMWTMKRFGAAPRQWCSPGSKKTRSPRG